MPVQGGTFTKQLWHYGTDDTGPPLRMDDGLRDMDGNVIDLTNAEKVLLSVGWASPNHTNMPTQEIVNRGEGDIVDAVTGVVEYPWKAGELQAAGRYDFGWEIVWNDGTVQTTKALAYYYITVQSPPFAQRGPYVP